MKKLVHLISICLLLTACVNEEQTTKSTVVEAPPEEEVLLRLTQKLTANPQDFTQKEQNALIQFAIDSLWNVEQTASGIWYDVVQQGSGDSLFWGDRLEVHYVGYFLNGQQFDSSYDRKRPLQFYIGNMIDGWNEALQLASVGSEFRLLVPSRLAYGEEGLITAVGDTLVPPNEGLAFKIEVLKKIR